MSSKFRFLSVLGLTMTIGGFAVVASAQEAVPAEKDKTQKQGTLRGDRHRGMRGMQRGGGFGMLRGIELTDAQKAQIKTILESNKPDQTAFEQLKAIREAHRTGSQLTDEQKAQLKSFRDAQRAKRQQVHQQIMNVLTAEQKQQLEQRRQQMQERRQQRRGPRQDNKTAPVKPTDS